MNLQVLGSQSAAPVIIAAGETLNVPTGLQFPDSSPPAAAAQPAAPDFIQLITTCPFLQVTDVYANGSFDVYNPTEDEVSFSWRAHHLHSDAQEPLIQVATPPTIVESPSQLCSLPGMDGPLAVHSRWSDIVDAPIPAVPPFYGLPFENIDVLKDDPLLPYVTWGVDAVAGRFSINRDGIYHIMLSAMIKGEATDSALLWLYQDPAGALNGVLPFFDIADLNFPSTGIQNNKLICHGTIPIDSTDPVAERTFEAQLGSLAGLAVVGDTFSLLAGSIEIRRIGNLPT